LTKREGKGLAIRRLCIVATLGRAIGYQEQEMENVKVTLQIKVQDEALPTYVIGCTFAEVLR
jgi:hypothetical protein